MTYRINKTDGNLLAEIPDGTFDTANSSLTLIGKNVTSFGEILNENLVKLLENFSSSTSPEHPIKGQLWYDTTTGRLNVFDGTDFRASGGPLISPTKPNNLVPGDLWINNETNQIWFYDGAGNPTLAGPIFTEQQGKTGFIVENIIDTSNRLKVIAKLYVNNVLIGIFSNSAFTPALPIDGFTGAIGIGFTSGTLSGNKFDTTVTKAESLITSLNQVKVADDILFNNEDGIIYGSLTVQSVDGIRLLGGDPGTNLFAQGDTFLKLEGGNFIIENNESSRAVEIRTKQPVGGTKTAIYVDSVNQRVGFFNNAPTSTVDITGDLKVSGNLIIEGESFSINTTTLEVEDKNIELNVLSSGATTDANADGGGITLHATLDKTITYSAAYDSWNSSQSFSVASGKFFAINNASVLTETNLGPSVTTIEGVTEIQSTLQYLNVDNVNINGNTITAANGNLILTASSNIDVNQKRIINLQDLDYATSPSSDAANKKYVDDRVSVRPIAMTVDISEFDVDTPNGMEAANDKLLEILNYTASIFDAANNTQGVAIQGTIAKIHCTHTTVTLDPIQYYPVQVGTPLTGTETIAYEKDTVNKGSSTENKSVVSDFIGYQVIPSPAATVSVARFYKRFEVIEQPDNSLAWEFVTDYAPKGLWSNTTAYSVNDLVLYDNKEWICILGVTGGSNPAANITNWKLFANI